MRRHSGRLQVLRSGHRGVWALFTALLLVAGASSVAVGVFEPTAVCAQEGGTEYAAEPGTLAVESTPPGAAVIVNGRRLGVTPLTLVMPSDATLRVRLELEGHQAQEETITIGAGQTHAMTVTLPSGE